MSPSQLSWFQQCLFFFLGVAAAYGLNWCQNCRTNRWTTSDVGLDGIHVDNGNTPTPFADAQSSGADEEARSPSNLSDPVGEAMASTGSLSSADRNRLRSESLRHPRRFLEPSAESRQTRPLVESGAQTEPPTFARRETADTTIVADRTPMSSPTAGLLRPSGGEVEALSREILLEDQARPLDGLRRRPERTEDPSSRRKRKVQLEDESDVPGVDCRAIRDTAASATRYMYEPRFKPESGAPLNFNCLKLGEYHTRREAEIVLLIATVLYGKEEGRPVQFEDGPCLPFPAVTEQEECPPSGEEKALWVTRKTMELYAEVLEEKARRLQPRRFTRSIRS